MLQAVVNKIRIEIGQEPIDWTGWKYQGSNPSTKGVQVDSWSCGLFVMMGIQALVDEEKEMNLVSNEF